MKLILIHADQNVRNHLKQLIDDLDHIVVAESDHPRRLLGDIARHQPHAIVVGELAAVFEDGTFPPLQDTVALVPVVRLPVNATDESLISFMKEALEVVRIEHQSRPARAFSTDDQRLVLQDDRYQAFEQKEKPGPELISSDPDVEKEIFIRQIHCAVKNHQAAKRYYRQVLKTEHGLKFELAHQLGRGSYKIYGLREHAIRWTSVLAHYIEGVEIDYLPSPASPSPELDFLHFEAPIQSLYTAAALVGHGFSPKFLSSFCSILSYKHTDQSDQMLHADGMFLWGWCSLLREIATAQLHFMDQALDPESSWHLGIRPKRRFLLAEGIYTDFWCLPLLRRNPAKMRDLAYLSVMDWLSPGSASSAIAPYRAFLEAHQGAGSVATQKEEGA